MVYKWYSIKLVIICVIIFVLQTLYNPLTDNFALVSSEFFSRPWIIVTHIFLHGGIEHIFFNMFALALFGSTLEKLIGGKRFLIVFFASGITAGIGSMIFYESSLGASGAIYGIMGTLAVLRPKMVVYVGYGVPMPMIVAVSLWAMGDLTGFFAPCKYVDGKKICENIAYAAHLFGLLFGLIYGFILRKKSKRKTNERKNDGNNIKDEEFRKWENDWLK